MIGFYFQVSQLHYQALNDATWSKDGHMVVVCSTDGYCSIIRFSYGELGSLYRGPINSTTTTTTKSDTGSDKPDHTTLPMAKDLTNLDEGCVVNSMGIAKQETVKLDLGYSEQTTIINKTLSTESVVNQ